jgi:hypothetical protein
MMEGIEGKVNASPRGALKAAAKYVALGIFALGAMGSDCESECCEELNCGSGYICSSSGPYSSRHICITNSEGHEECCGCVRDSNR